MKFLQSRPCRPRLWFLMLVVVILLVIVVQLKFTHVKFNNGYTFVTTNGQTGSEQQKKIAVPFDIHIEDGQHGHTGEVRAFSAPLIPASEIMGVEEVKRDPKNIAIGCGITSHGIRGLNQGNIGGRFPLFRTFLPSFCSTASAGFHYHFFLTYDLNDPFISQASNLDVFRKVFVAKVESMCSPAFDVSVHLVQCTHNGKPAWAQNDAMVEAYLDNMEYAFRINDDTKLMTSGWTESFIETLKKYSPSNVGVVGPKHRGGNEAILTYDFTHRTHVDIFGFHYPRLFTDWFADDWVTYVYKPGRSTKLAHISLIHTMDTGTRYTVHSGMAKYVKGRLEKDKKTLQRYIESIDRPNPDGKKVISMSLWGKDPKYTFGALRNAQLMKVYFPEWQLHIYMENPTRPTKHGAVPVRFVNKYIQLGAQVIYVNTTLITCSPYLWRFLTADNTNVDYFIVRDADSRISTRDADLVKQWVDSGAGVHCIRDYPDHTTASIVPGLWGAKVSSLKSLLQQNMASLLKTETGQNPDKFTKEFLWNKVQSSIMCHDSVSCTTWPRSYPIVAPREESGFVGATFSLDSEPIEEEKKKLKEFPAPKECSDKDFKPKDGMVFPTVNVPSTSTTTPPLLIPAQNLSSGDKPLKGVVIWNVDYHIAPIRDIKSLLEPLGAYVLDKSISGHCGMTKTCANNLRVLTSANAMEATADLAEEFTKEYANDPEMASVTHIVCTFPVSLCQVYKNLGKPLILIATNRYEQGHFMAEPWGKLNKEIETISTNKKNTIAANNKYDQAYMKHFLGIEPKLVPNYCSYVGASYNPTRKEFILGVSLNPNFEEYFLKSLEDSKANSKSDVAVKPLKHLYPQEYQYSDIASHPAVILLPYQVSMITFREYYTMNIPVFVPEQSLLIEYEKKYGLLSQRTWNSVRKAKGFTEAKSPIESKGSKMSDPNSVDEKTLTEWIPLADYYQLPHVIYFTSTDDLVSKLKSTDLKSHSESMKKFNEGFKANVTTTWKEILKQR